MSSHTLPGLTNHTLSKQWLMDPPTGFSNPRSHTFSYACICLVNTTGVLTVIESAAKQAQCVAMRPEYAGQQLTLTPKPLTLPSSTPEQRLEDLDVRLHGLPRCLCRQQLRAQQWRCRSAPLQGRVGLTSC